MTDKVYTDEELDFTGMRHDSENQQSNRWDIVEPQEQSKLIPWQTAYRLNDPKNAPEKIRLLTEMIQKNPWTIARNKAFSQQAIFMTDYTDNADIVPFNCYFPTYRDMTIMQQRAYFSLRTSLRLGKTVEAPLSYLFVYVYELLMLIGVENAEEALELLEELNRNYATMQPKLGTYLEPWLKDFVVYYNITNKIPQYFEREVKEDRQAQALSNYQKISDGLLMETIYQLSGFKVKSMWQGNHMFERVAAYVVRKAIPAIEQHYHHKIETLCFGMKKKLSHPMFQNAVFYDPNPPMNVETEITSRRHFICRSGLWTEDTFDQKFFARKGELFANILHETDRQLRLLVKKGAKLQPKAINSELRELIHQAIIEWNLERIEAARPKIEVDLTKLGQIRKDAAIVREALLTEEEREEARTENAMPSAENYETSITPSAENLELSNIPRSSDLHTMEINSQPSIQPTANSLFTPEEQSFLKLMLENGDWQTYLRAIHTPAGVITESINEKMMEEIDDIIIENDAIIPDYIEEIRERIENRE